jgi:rare lipoprotein A
MLLLAACQRAPVKPGAPAAESSPSSRPAPPRGARPDQPGEYTAGGLYKPGVRDNAPSERPDISQLQEPVPRDEPRSRYGNRSPYTVLGKSYRVMDSAEGYVERGIASWYGEKFHGRATSSFEPYDMYAFSAAHKTLPLPSFARVTRLDTGQSVVVRVNDRGPFHQDRLIDLSYAAAIKLGIDVSGTARVEVRSLSGEATDSGSVPVVSGEIVPALQADRQQPTWLQIASFGERDNAKRLLQRLRAADLGRVRIQRGRAGGERVYRVRIGPLPDMDAARQLAARVRALGFGQPAFRTR